MDTGFHYDKTLGSALNQHAISFQSSAIESTSEKIMMGHYNQMNNSTVTTSTRFLGNSSTANSNTGFTQSMNSCVSVLGDSGPVLNHVTGLAVDWSVEEQHKLEEGLSIFADETSIMRYIKIAATLNDKTVRDVALRCRWMARKRRKQDERYMTKKLKEKKENLAALSSKPSVSSVPKLDVAPFSIAMNRQVQIDGIFFEALSGSIKHLLEQNSQFLGQISANISSLKLQDNIDFFSHTKNNITAILNDMRYMPGPPFPVTLNEDLVQSILLLKNQRMMFESSNGMYVKQEPEC